MYFPTAVADALLYTPVLKHILGVFGLISASKKSLVRVLTQNRGPEGCVVLYVGGMAELFLSCDRQERLYLKNRKGFIKLALSTGVDVVPVYLFGNTAVLSILKTGLLAAISRKLQVSLTYVWGRWYLPVPRPTKLLYVSGQPLGMPRIPEPTQQDVDKWHDKYCAEVKRLFDRYKERVPEYKHKQLEIL
jgi:2-acylglycerol O-acyltransferase 2